MQTAQVGVIKIIAMTSPDMFIHTLAIAYLAALVLAAALGFVISVR